MGSFLLEDLSGTVSVLVWPNSWEKYRDLIENDLPVLIKGRCEVDGKGEARVLCFEILELDSLWKKVIQKTRIRISLPSLDSQKVSQLHTLVTDFPGKCPLEFELLEKKGYRIRVVPQEDLRIDPIPSFVEAVEKLFGENSVALYT
jgi:DNA polymerase-3 subunit alpha